MPKPRICKFHQKWVMFTILMIICSTMYSVSLVAIGSILIDLWSILISRISNHMYKVILEYHIWKWDSMAFGAWLENVYNYNAKKSYIEIWGFGTILGCFHISHVLCQKILPWDMMFWLKTIYWFKWLLLYQKVIYWDTMFWQSFTWS